VNLEIRRWAFWSPETREPSEWREHWSRLDARALDAKIQGRSVPAAQRRRMSALATLAVQIATEAAGGTAADFLVFASQHGDVTSMRAMLDDVAAGTELSPTMFSQSVHNASAGLYTIISHSRAPVCALSSGASTFAAAWLEAEGFLSNHVDASVLLVSYDEALPPEYAAYSPQRQCAHALGLLLRSARGEGVELAPAPRNTTSRYRWRRCSLPGSCPPSRRCAARRTGTAGSGVVRGFDVEPVRLIRNRAFYLDSPRD
jgi:hypothetical protein